MSSPPSPSSSEGQPPALTSEEEDDGRSSLAGGAASASVDDDDDDDDDDDEEGGGDVAKMTVLQLKAECAERGLPVGGRKEELVERLGGPSSGGASASGTPKKKKAGGKAKVAVVDSTQRINNVAETELVVAVRQAIAGHRVAFREGRFEVVRALSNLWRVTYATATNRAVPQGKKITVLWLHMLARAGYANADSTTIAQGNTLGFSLASIHRISRAARAAGELSESSADAQWGIIKTCENCKSANLDAWRVAFLAANSAPAHTEGCSQAKAKAVLGSGSVRVGSGASATGSSGSLSLSAHTKGCSQANAKAVVGSGSVAVGSGASATDSSGSLSAPPSAAALVPAETRTLPPSAPEPAPVAMLTAPNEAVERARTEVSAPAPAPLPPAESETAPALPVAAAPEESAVLAGGASGGNMVSSGAVSIATADSATSGSVSIVSLTLAAGMCSSSGGAVKVADGASSSAALSVDAASDALMDPGNLVDGRHRAKLSKQAVAYSSAYNSAMGGNRAKSLMSKAMHVSAPNAFVV